MKKILYRLALKYPALYPYFGVHGFLPDWAIRILALEHGLITPFEESKLQPYGYDVCIQNKLKYTTNSKLYPGDKEYLESLDWYIDTIYTKTRLEPGKVYQVLSREYFILPNNVTLAAVSRSSCARCEIEPVVGASCGDAGWRGYFQFELHSVGLSNVPIVDTKRPIAQMLFSACSHYCDRPYSEYGHNYQNQKEIRL